MEFRRNPCRVRLVSGERKMLESYSGIDFEVGVVSSQIMLRSRHQSDYQHSSVDQPGRRQAQQTTLVPGLVPEVTQYTALCEPHCKCSLSVRGSSVRCSIVIRTQKRPD